jgi:hypothetical protein
MEGLFSKRFSKALDDKRIPNPSFSQVLRNRLAMKCRQHCENCGGFVDTESEVVNALKRAYGRAALRVRDEATKGSRDTHDFWDFLNYAYPNHVIDAIEAFYRLLSVGTQHAFQVAVNAVLAEEDSPWLLSDGRMYMVDSRFLDALKNQIEDEMRREGFLGAHEEFRDARGYLQAGDMKVAIQKANCAFESFLKSLLNQSEGSADDLLKKLQAETDLLHGVPSEAQKVIVSKVLHGLTALRHKIGGHGSQVPLNVPRAYGDLAVNLAATYIKFLVDLKRQLAPPKNSEDNESLTDEKLPF